MYFKNSSWIPIIQNKKWVLYLLVEENLKYKITWVILHLSVKWAFPYYWEIDYQCRSFPGAEDNCCSLTTMISPFYREKKWKEEGAEAFLSLSIISDWISEQIPLTAAAISQDEVEGGNGHMDLGNWVWRTGRDWCCLKVCSNIEIGSV